MACWGLTKVALAAPMVSVATGSHGYRGDKKGGKMKIINLTPHPIAVLTKEGMITFPPSGTVARVSQIEEPAGSLDGVQLVRIRCGQVDGLPDEQEGVMYLVSRLVFERCVWRHDLLVPDTGPGSAIRDSSGNIVGVTRFICR